MLFHLNSGKIIELNPNELTEMAKLIHRAELVETCRKILNSGTFMKNGGKYGNIQILLGDKEMEEIVDMALDTMPKGNSTSDTHAVRECMDMWYKKNENAIRSYVIAVTGTVRVNCPDSITAEKANKELDDILRKNTFEPLIYVKTMNLPPVDKKDGTIDYRAMVSGQLYVESMSKDVVSEYAKTLTTAPLEDVSIEVQQWPALARNMLSATPEGALNSSKETPTRLALTVRFNLSTFLGQDIPDEELVDEAKRKVLLAADDYISDVRGKIVDRFVNQNGQVHVKTIEVSAYTYLDGSVKASPETVPEVLNAILFNRFDMKYKVRISIDPVAAPKPEKGKPAVKEKNSNETAFTAEVTGYLTFFTADKFGAEYAMEREDLGPLQEISWDIFPGCERDVWIARVTGYVSVCAQSPAQANTMISEMDFHRLRDVDWKLVE